MCQVTHPAAVRERFGRLATALDPDDLPASHAPSLWRELDQLERLVAAAKVAVARRVDDSLAWQREGFASAAEYLAAHGGTSVGAARKQLDTSKALPELPTTRQALLDGALSPDRSALIAEAAKVNPGAERTLVEAAGRDSFRERKDRTLRAKAAGDPDPAATQRRIHRQRRLREFVDSEGAWNLQSRGTVADGAKIHAALAPLIEEVFTEGRAAGTRDTPEARAFDALVRLGDRATTPGPRRGRRHQALVRCDLEALQRGAVEGDEVCEVAGVGPIPVEHAVELLGEPSWKLLVTRGVDVLNVTTLSRKATAAMLAALAWRIAAPPHLPKPQPRSGHPGAGCGCRPRPRSQAVALVVDSALVGQVRRPSRAIQACVWQSLNDPPDRLEATRDDHDQRAAGDRRGRPPVAALLTAVR